MYDFSDDITRALRAVQFSRQAYQEANHAQGPASSRPDTPPYAYDKALGLSSTIVYLAPLERACPEAIAAARKDPTLLPALALAAYIVQEEYCGAGNSHTLF